MFFCLLCVRANGQERLSFLKAQLLQADTVLIVSHKQTAGISLIDETTGKELPLPKLVVNGRPNRSIFLEERVIRDTGLQALAQILSRPFEDKTVERAMCFMPHHAVLILKKGKTSFIDICFTCSRLETSRDIRITSDDFDKRKWSELEAFFIQRDMKFMLKQER